MLSALCLASLLVATGAHACGCDKPRTLADVAGSKPDVVFEGTVVDVLGSEEHRVHRAHVTFTVDRMHQSPASERISVDFGQGGASCDLEPLAFAAGRSYLISASSHGPARDDLAGSGASGARKSYHGHFCDLREPRTSRE